MRFRWKFASGILALGVAIGVPLVASTDWLASLGSAATGARLEKMKSSPQYGTDSFVNSQPVDMPVESDPATMWQVSKEYVVSDAVRSPPNPLPVVDPRGTLATEPTTGLRITWLGHSTVLIEIDGKRILTDPVWGRRASPSTLVGPARFHPPPVSLDELGPIDAVLISHDHYDHLDYPTILELRERGVHFYVPIGVGAHLEGWDVSSDRIHEFDWWEESQVGPVRLVATPAQHFSGRGVLDRNAKLWLSWTILGPEHRVYFSGDTGMAPEFVDIGEKYGPFDVAMLEVGAYHDAWGSIHLGPRQAVAANKLLRGEVMLPIHWGTFDLGIHSWYEPGAETRRIGASEGVNVMSPRIGEPVEPTLDVPVVAWWENLQ